MAAKPEGCKCRATAGFCTSDGPIVEDTTPANGGFDSAGVDGQGFWKSLRFPMWLGFVRLRGPADIDQKSARPKPTPRRVPAPRPACVGSHSGLSHRERTT